MMLALAAAISLLQGVDGTTVGYPGTIEELVLEGSQLKVRALGVASPLVLRIVHVFPHGDNFRYDFEYYGLDPGEYDLRDYLERPDGSALDDLSPISSLKKLDALRASLNLVSDVTPLAGLTNMDRLDLGHTKIKDVTPLAGMSKLTDKCMSHAGRG